VKAGRRLGARRLLAAPIALCVALGALAVPAAALRLPIDKADARALGFAEGTCHRDRLCRSYGVLNCRRQAPHVVLCRIFDQRRTRAQGRYRCERLIRMTLDPRTRRIPITGLGRWHC
jgi:hypothetical protein